jgi:hypothetical protein
VVLVELRMEIRGRAATMVATYTSILREAEVPDLYGTSFADAARIRISNVAMCIPIHWQVVEATWMVLVEVREEVLKGAGRLHLRVTCLTGKQNLLWRR